MQKGFGNFGYKALCEEFLERFDLLAPRDVVLARSNDVVSGTSSFEPTSSLKARNDQDTPETPQPTEQDQRWLEAEWVAYLDAVGKGKSKGTGKNGGKADVD